MTTRLIKDLFSKKKILQNKPTNFFKNISYKKKLYFYEVKTKQNKLEHFYQGFGKAYFALHFIEKMSAERKKSNLYQIKAIISKKKDSSFPCVLRTITVSHGISMVLQKCIFAQPHIQHIWCRRHNCAKRQSIQGVSRRCA